MKKINLNEVIIQKDSNNNQNDNTNKSDYQIYLYKKDLSDIIFSLNVLITDIKNSQNKEYLISQIEKIIFKLKNFDIPPEIQLNTIPTFKTINLYDDNESNYKQEIKDKEPNYNKIEFDLKELGIDTKTYCSNADTENSSKNSMNKYEGQLINGKKEGKGKFIYKNGCIYEGYFKNDKKEGKGIFYYTNGDREMGDYLDGKKVGKHVILYKNGKFSHKDY